MMRFHACRSSSRSARLRSERARSCSDQPLGGLAEELLARAVHDAQDLVRIEGEDRHVDLLQHLAERLGSLDRAEALVPQDLLELVDLEVGERERVGAVPDPGPDREVAFPQGGEHVRQRPERSDDLLPKGDGDARPDAHQPDRGRPLDPGRVVAEPEEHERHGHPGQPREDREDEDPLIVGEPLPPPAHGRAYSPPSSASSASCRCSRR